MTVGIAADGLLGSIEKSIRIGRPVAQAVVDAHAENGRYPETLAEIDSEFLEAIPESATVRLVHLPDPKLTVKIREDLTVGYDFIEKRWFSARNQRRWLNEPPVLPSTPK